MSKKRRTPDAENPEWTEEMFARARSASEIMPELVASRPRIGRPKLEKPKQQISLRIDPDILAAYRRTGAGWQKRMQDALAKSAPRRGKSRRSA